MFEYSIWSNQNLFYEYLKKFIIWNFIYTII